MKSLLKRIEIVEREMDISTIPERDRIIVISYPDGDEAEHDRLLQERMAELKSKYGPNISEDDFLIIGIRKFTREGRKNENQ